MLNVSCGLYLKFPAMYVSYADETIFPDNYPAIKAPFGCALREHQLWFIAYKFSAGRGVVKTLKQLKHLRRHFENTRRSRATPTHSACFFDSLLESCSRSTIRNADVRRARTQLMYPYKMRPQTLHSDTSSPKSAFKHTLATRGVRVQSLSLLSPRRRYQTSNQ